MKPQNKLAWETEERKYLLDLYETILRNPMATREEKEIAQDQLNFLKEFSANS